MTDYMTDHRGAKVPVSKIKPQQLEEDALVRQIADQAQLLSGLLAEFKSTALGDVQAFRDLLAEQYETQIGGKKGNITLRSYDGSIELQIAVGESMAFGPELEAARALIETCITRWSEGSNDNIRVLVNDAFQVNKHGRIDTHRVLGLRRFEFEDPEWKRAMDGISDALRIVSTKTYVRVYRRDPETEEKTPIELNVASV